MMQNKKGRLKSIKSLVVSYKGTIQIMNRVEYLKILRGEHFLEIPKLLGTLDPYDKTGLRWEVEKKPPREFYLEHFSHNQIQRLLHLVLMNAEYLINKGPNNFVNNFNEVVIKKLKKPIKVLK